ncbi:MAG TPA: hypothetical protein VKA26_07385 [Ignavibacteriaceae bacterium]|nr:hypothetical protein [Ignavibacteriaceae bacterium]
MIQKNPLIKLFNYFLLTILLSSLTFSQTVPQSAYSGMKWRLVGPYRAGWATVADGIPDQPNTFYFGGAGGGVWKTTDAGRTWEGLMQNESAAAVGGLAIAPSNPKTIYVGTGQVALRYDILDGDGVFKTTDGGETWKNVGLKNTKYIGRILVDQKDENKVIVAALGHVFGDSKDRGIYVTTDGGKNWQQTLFTNDTTGAVDLGYDMSSPDIIYAAMWQVRSFPWMDYYVSQAGKSSGIYKSMDGGFHWTKLSGGGLPDVPKGRIGLAVGQNTNAQTVYATIDEAGDQSGFYRSEDGGKNWKRVNTDGELVSSYFARVNVDPTNPKTVYVMGRSVHKSTDGGDNFEILKGSPGGDDYHFMWINPKYPDHMITAADQGAAVSVNDGGTWSSWYNQPTGQFYHLGADDRFPYHIYSAQQDNGTVEILSQGPYGVIEIRDWHPVGADERDYDIPKPGNPNIVFGSGLGGTLHRFDEETRQSIDVSPWPQSSYAAKPNTVKYRFSWITPIEFSPIGKHALYYGAQYLFRTLDDGDHWEIISPDLSRKKENAKKDFSGLDFQGAADAGYGVIWNIAPSPVKEDVIWIGTDDGLIQLTTDGGKNWNNVTPPEIPIWSRIDKISPSPFDVHSAYAAVNMHRLDRFEPLLLKTNDDGKTWKVINNGIPTNEYTTVIRTDTDKKGLLFAATDKSIYVSFNDGENWQSLKLNFPTTLITDLLVHHDDLIVSSQGRGIWILDDLSPLRQISKEMTEKNVFLFDPLAAWRMRGNTNHDTPWPPSTPLGKNPPDGAIIDYWLKDNIQEPVKLSVYDMDGNLIRSYSSNDKPEELPANRYFDKRWLGTDPKITNEAGMHRFVWNLRYPRPKALNYGYSIAAVWTLGTPVEPKGPLVMPGKYKLVLTADGKDYTREINIKLDPRVKVSENTLKNQLDLAMKVNTTLDNAVTLFKKIDSQLKSYNDDLSKKAKDNLSKMKSLTARLCGALSGFASSVQAADASPTQGQKELFKDFQSQYDQILKDWNSFSKM